MSTRLKTQEDLINDNQVIIDHPEYGQVVFTGPTLRQRDILEDYKKLKLKTSK